MLLVNYESPDGEKRFGTLWNGGNGYGDLKLYRRKFFFFRNWSMTFTQRTSAVNTESTTTNALPLAQKQVSSFETTPKREDPAPAVPGGVFSCRPLPFIIKGI